MAREGGILRFTLRATGLDQAVARLERLAERALAVTVDKGAGVMARGVRAWPRKTGSSARGLDLEVRRRGFLVVLRGSSSARYTGFIVSRGRHAWTTLIETPWRTAYADLDRELAGVFHGR